MKRDNSTPEPTWKKVVEFLSKPIPLLIINVIAALLFFPFEPATSLPAGLGVAGSLAFGWLAWRQRKLVYFTASFFLGILSLSWAAVGVFLLSDVPLYCYSMPQPVNPLSSELVPIGQNKTVARVFYVADPIRNWAPLKRVVKRYCRNIFFLETRINNDNGIMLMPLDAAVRHTVVGTSPVNSAQELLLSSYGPVLMVDINVGSKKSMSMNLGILHWPIIDFVRKASEAPWEEIAYTTATARNSALYLAYSEAGLSAASRGDFEVAIESLESAYDLAPSAVEKARNRALLGIISAAVINGNVGVTQSLSYFNEAMQEWPLSQQGTILAGHLIGSPLDRWIYKVLAGVFYWRQHEFPQWAKILGFKDVPTYFRVESPTRRGFSLVRDYVIREKLPEESLFDTEIRRVLSLVGKDGQIEALEADVRERYGFSEEAQRWTADTLLNEVEAKELVLGLSFEETPLFKAAGLVIERLPEPTRTRYAKCFRATRDLLEASRRSLQSSDLRPSVEYFRHFAEEWGFPETATIWEQVPALVGQEHDELQFKKMPTTSSEPWWDRRFLDWFAANVAALVQEVRHECQHPSAQCRTLLTSAASLLSRDQSGHGRLFAPGIALVLMCADATKQEIDADPKTMYREAVGGDPAAILADTRFATRTSSSQPHSPL